MKILFYSTNSNVFNGSDWNYFTYPSVKDQFDNYCSKHPENEYIVLTQLPGLFLLDVKDSSIEKKSSFVKYELLQDDNIDAIVEKIASFSPDLVIAFSFWLAPFDWLCLKDSVIGEKLKARGIKTLANPSETSLISFDKNLTHNFLKEHGFNVKKAVYVNHELFFKSKKEIKENVYKTAILYEISKMHYPIVVKDTTGLSSFAMDVCHSYQEAEKLLLSKRNNSDRLVEEYIQGLHFGTEIYGSQGSYRIMPPFLLSLNKYGITSPKQSIKIGPVSSSAFKIEELNKELERLANLMNFSGIAQTDLVFDGKNWFIVDINPRLSGISGTYSVSSGKSIFELVLDKEYPKTECALNFKFPLLTEEQIESIKKLPFTKAIRQFENKAAKQDREVGYCEVIFGSTKKIQELEGYLDYLNENFPQIVEPLFYSRGKELFRMLEKIE
ncbi:MAG: ATP-grasp domain-containing protein [Treponema sp.]|nr:ATP-grasp domain-containing protein [Treponema sp.]